MSADSKTATVLAVMSLVVFGLAARLRALGHVLSGDEPHYLILSRTLKAYHSLDVMRVYNNHGYWRYYPGPIEPHVAQGPHGTLPLHNIGGPLLWHIPYLLWDYAGVLAFMTCVSALTIVNIFYFLRELGIVSRYATIVTALFAIGSPLYQYSSMVFIEPIAALFLVFAVRALVRPNASTGRLALASAALGMMPWLHGRFMIFAVLVPPLLVWRTWQRTPRATWNYVACLAPAAVLVIGAFVFNAVLWHSWNIAPANALHGDGIFQIPLTHGLAGLALDRSFGLFTNFPIMALALPGLFLALRRQTLALYAVFALAIAPYVVVIGTFAIWFGGFCPPARYLVVFAPLLSFFVATTLQRLRSWWMIGFASVLALAAFTLGLIGDLNPELRYQELDVNKPLDALDGALKTNISQHLSFLATPYQRGPMLLVMASMAAFTVLICLVARRRTARPDHRGVIA